MFNSRMGGRMKLGPQPIYRGLKRTALALGATGLTLFAGGAVVFRKRNASPLQIEDLKLEGKTYVVTGGTSGICSKNLHYESLQLR